MNHSFNTRIAKLYGVKEAILFENIYFWVKENKSNNINFKDGKYWTYNSVKSFQEIFDYLSAKEIYGALNRLEAKGLIISGSFSNNHYDRTKWYTISDEGESVLEKLSKDTEERTDVLLEEVITKEELKQTLLNPLHFWRKDFPADEKFKLIKKQTDNFCKTEDDFKELKSFIQSMEYKSFLRTPYWTGIADYKKSLAGYRCELCNSDLMLSVHHRSYANHGDEINHLEDLFCICARCHKTFHGK